MILELVTLSIFTAFVILGVHAVTRPGMLLSFLGQQSGQEQNLIDSEMSFINDNLKMQEDFLNDVERISASDNKNDRFEIIEIAIGYLGACDERAAMHDEDTIDMETEFERQQNQLVRKSLKPISAPLTECTTCMSSVWSVLVFCCYFLISPISLLFFIPFSVAGLIQIFESIKK